MDIPASAAASTLASRCQRTHPAHATNSCAASCTWQNTCMATTRDVAQPTVQPMCSMRTTDVVLARGHVAQSVCDVASDAGKTAAGRQLCSSSTSKRPFCVWLRTLFSRLVVHGGRCSSTRASVGVGRLSIRSSQTWKVREGGVFAWTGSRGAFFARIKISISSRRKIW